MAVVLRLRQEGAHGRHVYRVVAADQRFKRDGRFLEILGNYNPAAEKGKAVLDLAKVDSWISKGAQPTPTVKSLIKNARIAAAK
jgi:small subunit ribosomal protein S16